ncbi:MAG: hypothetical protein JXR34_05925 [Bacteroidales bacterium]|nr:hypothetical protein [Bacteroidales bacterium]
MTFKVSLSYQFILKLYSLGFLILTIGLFSCRKNEDTQYPIIQYIKPYENSFFSVGDTIVIQAEISDNENLEFVDITLTDENFNPVLKTYNPPFNSNPFTLVFDYPIYDNFLESGIYNIQIRAGDGTQIKNKYQRINIGALPKTNIGYAYQCGSPPNSLVGIFYQQPVFHNAPFNFSSSGKYQFSAIPYQNVLAVAELNSGKVILYNYITQDSLTYLKDISFVDKSLVGLSSSSKSLYLFFDNGINHRYNYLGFRNIVFGSANFVTTNLLEHDNHIITTCRRTTFPFQERIQTYQLGTGAALNSYYLDFQVIGFHKTQNNFLVLGIKNQEVIAYEYTYSQNQLSKLRSFGNMIIQSSCKINEELFLLLSDSKVLLFDTKTRTYSTFLDNFISGSHIKFDEVKNLIFIVKDRTVFIYSYPNKTLIGQTDIDPNLNINQIELLYNR